MSDSCVEDVFSTVLFSHIVNDEVGLQAVYEAGLAAI